jgi:hypothetical protein
VGKIYFNFGGHELIWGYFQIFGGKVHFLGGKVHFFGSHDLLGTVSNLFGSLQLFELPFHLIQKIQKIWG